MKPMYCKGPDDAHWRRVPEPRTWPLWLGLAVVVVVLMLGAARALAQETPERIIAIMETPRRMFLIKQCEADQYCEPVDGYYDGECCIQGDALPASMREEMITRVPDYDIMLNVFDDLAITVPFGPTLAYMAIGPVSAQSHPTNDLPPLLFYINIMVVALIVWGIYTMTGNGELEL